MADPDGWDIEFYADKNGREPCREWADNLSPQKRAAFLAAVELVLARRGLDVVETEFGKPLGMDSTNFASDGLNPKSSTRSPAYLLKASVARPSRSC